MDINRFLEELDRLFEEKNINDVEPFLRISMDKATEEEDKSAHTDRCSLSDRMVW